MCLCYFRPMNGVAPRHSHTMITRHQAADEEEDERDAVRAGGAGPARVGQDDLLQRHGAVPARQRPRRRRRQHGPGQRAASISFPHAPVDLFFSSIHASHAASTPCLRVSLTAKRALCCGRDDGCGFRARLPSPRTCRRSTSPRWCVWRTSWRSSSSAPTAVRTRWR